MSRQPRKLPLAEKPIDVLRINTVYIRQNKLLVIVKESLLLKRNHRWCRICGEGGISQEVESPVIQCVKSVTMHEYSQKLRRRAPYCWQSTLIESLAAEGIEKHVLHAGCSPWTIDSVSMRTTTRSLSLLRDLRWYAVFSIWIWLAMHRAVLRCHITCKCSSNCDPRTTIGHVTRPMSHSICCCHIYG